MKETEGVRADYLVIGAGAMGMAFADALLAGTKATIAIVDEYHRPGGHWTMAYPFVRLHQPSAFYGVNSKELGANTIDQIGWNKGLYEMATGDEVCSYYSQVMNQHFLPSGRVTYFPKCRYVGDGVFVSVLSGKRYRVGPQTRIFNATYMGVVVPSMRSPGYQVSDDVKVVTPNDLTRTTHYANYTVVGAGKTGIDSCLWLLGMGVDPAHITWIVPRDAWLFDRAAFQLGPKFAEKITGGFKKQAEAIMAAVSVDDLFLRLEANGNLLRLNKNVWPAMFRCATVSLAELEQLRRITNVVRKGRVTSVSSTEIQLTNGSHPAMPNTLYIDCSANSLEKVSPVPVFKGNTITLQPVRFCQQVFSAAFIAHVEAAYDDDKVRNDICSVIPHPEQAVDWLTVSLLNHRNSLRWGAEPKTTAWLKQARLDWFGALGPPLPEDPEQRSAALQMISQQVEALRSKLHKLLLDQPEKQAAQAKAELAHVYGS